MSVEVITDDISSETTDLVRVSTNNGDYSSMEDTRNAAGPVVIQKEESPDDRDPQRKLKSCRPDEETKQMAKFLLKRQKVLILVTCTSAIFLASCASALLTSFFATVAETKGLTAIHVGFVFGICELGIVITSPFFGSYLTTIGSKFVFLSGILVAGVCNILFGITFYCPDGTPFLVSCLLVRLVGAIGVSAFSTASYALASRHFSENVGSVLAILETGLGVGYTLGPVIGGSLYELGGFGLPFYTMGGLTLLSGILVFISLPSSDIVETNKSDQSMFRLLRSPAMHVLLLSAFFIIFTCITVDAILVKDVASFGLSPVNVGLLYVLYCTVFTVPLPLMGYLCDKKDIQTPLIAGGQLMYAVGTFLLGPQALFPGIPFNLGTVCAGLVLMGISIAFSLTPNMKYMVIVALEMGYSDDLDTYAMISGLFYTSYHLGGFLGPVVSGFVAEAYSYQMAFTVCSLLNLGMAVVCGVFFSNKHFWKRHGHNF